MGGEVSQGAGKILVVDDTPANVDLLQGLLTRDGYVVQTAVNGEDALAAARAPRRTAPAAGSAPAYTDRAPRSWPPG